MQKSHEQNALDTLKAGREALDCVFWVFNHGHFQGTAEFLTNMNRAVTYLNALVHEAEKHIQLIETRGNENEQKAVSIGVKPAGRKPSTVQRMASGKGKKRRVLPADLSNKKRLGFPDPKI